MEKQRGTVLVTGGSRGIGRAICLRLARDGYAVAVNYSGNREKAEGVAAEVGGLAVVGDVSNQAQVREMFEAAEKALGPLTALVNNAGILGPQGRIDEADPEELRRLFGVNVLGQFFCAREAIRRMSTLHGGKGGAIVNLSSVAARLGGAAGLAAYASTKGAVETFTRGLATEVAGEGIRVNAVAPGITATEMAMSSDAIQAAIASIPLKRAGEPEEIAEAVAWLLSPASSYVTGSVITASGGR